MKTLPMLRMVDWLSGNRVRLFFAVGKSIKVVEMRLPWIKNARNVRVVDYGMGLALGDGRDVSALGLWESPYKKVLVPKDALPARQEKKRRSKRLAA